MAAIDYRCAAGDLLSPSVPIRLEMKGITKRFPGVVALSGVSLDVRGGEVLSLMGENGAGKSTLMKILGGAQPPDEGQILIDGQPVELGGIADAKKRGIALIHQELMLAPNVDIAGNIFLGNEKRLGFKFGPMDRRAMHAAATSLLARVGLNLPSSTTVSRLTAGQMQMVEIAKALSVRVRVIIMDEPTSSLTSGESEHLFGIIRQLKAQGIAIIYISHRMDEVMALSDRITVMRDGKYVGDLTRADATRDKLISMMVGRAFTSRYPDRPATAAAGEPVLEVSDVIVPGAATGVSFVACRGEILGFAGLVGSGRTELMQVLFGADPSNGGSMKVDGKEYKPRNVRDAINRGVYLAPEDRKRHGLVLPMSVAQNTSLPDVNNYNSYGWLSRGTEHTVALAEVKRMRIKTPDVDRKVVNLSGGNQQKVVLGKWLAMRPRVLILDEPTRGIDVGAKAEIYNTMVELAATGITILMVSSDMEEVIGMSDRVAVMHERKLKAVIPRSQANPITVGALMTGQSVPAPAAATATPSGTAAGTVVTSDALVSPSVGPHGQTHSMPIETLDGREDRQ
jgi:ribose transport system ATP-binding protein